MGALTGLIEHMDWMSMLLFLMSGAACLICLTSTSWPTAWPPTGWGIRRPRSMGG